MADWRIEHLDHSHERDDFSCGNAALDVFLQKLSRQYEKRHLGRTYVAVRGGERRVFGYYTLASASVAVEKLPPSAARKLPHHPIPTILLARLAVDQTAKGQGLGKLLLFDGLHRSQLLAGELGVLGVVVEAIDAEAQAFYQKYGFEAPTDDPRHLYLPMVTIDALFPTSR